MKGARKGTRMVSMMHEGTYAQGLLPIKVRTPHGQIPSSWLFLLLFLLQKLQALLVSLLLLLLLMIVITSSIVITVVLCFVLLFS